MTVHSAWLKEIEETKLNLSKQGIQLQLPPPSLIELKIEYLEITPGKVIKGKAPFQKRFSNPIHTFQGGFLTAIMDDHFGPLAYLTARSPCTTLNMSMTFLRPFIEKDEFCIIEAEVLKKSKSFIFMRGIISSINGDILAHSESHVTILKEDQLKIQVNK
jgi:acyl-coenzyme A thioesterase PaaI-like protein